MIHKVIEIAVDVGTKKGKELCDLMAICMLCTWNE